MGMSSSTLPEGTTHIGPAKSYEGDYSYLAEVLQSVLPDVAPA